MKASITLTQEDGALRIETAYPTDFDGVVSINVLLENANLPLLELQAQACEFAAAALSKRAANFRQQAASTPTSQ
ncbi:MAG: hypothetical protein WA191_07050 [Telluria sp.]